MTTTIYSAASSTVFASGVSDECWLKDLADPTRNIPVSIDGQNTFSISFDYGMGAFDVIGRRNPVPVIDVRKGDKFSFIIQLLHVDEPALDLMIDSARALFLQLTDTRQWHFVVDSGQKNLFAGDGNYLTVNIKAIEVDQPV